MEIDFRVALTDKLGASKEIVLKLDNANSNEMHIYGFLRAGHSYEPDVTKIVQRILEPGDVFIDVGANVGYFTMLAAALVGSDGKVFSFEPDPKNIERIRYHCGNNHYDNVEIIARPASHAEEEVQFYFNKDNSGGNALWNPGEFVGDPAFNDGYTVMTSTTLSKEFGTLGIENVKLIKIDTEGAEHSILRGAGEWLRNQSVPYIIAEMNSFGLKQLDSSVDQLVEFMYTQGYLAFLLYFDGRSPQFICPGMDIHTAAISNILFTTPAGFSKVWPIVEHNPGVVYDEATRSLRVAA